MLAFWVKNGEVSVSSELATKATPSCCLCEQLCLLAQAKPRKSLLKGMYGGEGIIWLLIGSIISSETPSG